MTAHNRAMPHWRQRLNHTADGRPRGANRRLGPLELLGAALLVAALLLWLFRAELGVAGGWAWAPGIAGLLLSRLGARRATPAAADQTRFDTPGARLLQALVGALCTGVGAWALADRPPQPMLLLAALGFFALGANALWAAWRGTASWLLRWGPFF